MRRVVFAFGFALLLVGLFVTGQARSQQPCCLMGVWGGGSGSSVTLNTNQSGDAYLASATTFYDTNNGLVGGTNLMSVAPGSGTVLVCAVNRADAANDVGAGLTVQWDAAGGSPQSMTPIVSVTKFTNIRYAGLWGLEAPHAGTLQLKVSGANSAADNFVGCAAFNGANATFGNAFPNMNSTTTVMASLACTSNAGHQVVGTFQPGNSTGVLLGTTIFNGDNSGSLINASADFVTGVNPNTSVGTTAVNFQLAVCSDISP